MLLEKVVFSQVTEHLNKNKLTYTFQSTYSHGHSAETALLRVLGNFLVASDCNNDNNNLHLSCAHQRPERSHDTY